MNEFPKLTFLPAIGYRIKYSRKKENLPAVLFFQLPRLLLTIIKEHRWIKKVLKQHQITAVISDNRFGLFCKKIPSVYITHQLVIKTNNRFTQKLATQFHSFVIKRFGQCWIPDSKEKGLAGELSHPAKLNLSTIYIGPLSRFIPREAVEPIYSLLVSISGPEPQRTIFEEVILRQLSSYEGKVLFVRGLPGNTETLRSPRQNITIKNHLESKDMNAAILQSSMIISRCGYTTIMDLVKLGKKAILIPTPGQTEQEYLAHYLREQKMFYSLSQEKFSLKKALEDAALFPFNIPRLDMENYKLIVKEFVDNLKKGSL